MIYQDNLLSITEDQIIFEHYYFPTGRKKIVQLDDIEWIRVTQPTIRNGKRRIHGTGDFKTWFPKDKMRPKRDRIFLAKLRSQRVQIGFTVEDADHVETIFNEKRLIISE